MSVDPVGFLPPVGGASLPAALVQAEPAATSAAGFGDWFVRELGQVNQQLVGAQSELQGLALGDAQNLHQVMIRLEETKLAFQLMVQVRNRLLEAYQDVLRMQI